MARNVRDVLGGPAKPKDDEYPWYKEHGMGTPVAEYGEDGPYCCADCWYLKSRDPRSNPLGYCNEPHMLDDPKTLKTTAEGERMAIVHKAFGCCRFIDPVQPGDRRDRYVFANDLEEEAEEHGEETSEEASEEETENEHG